jgi:SAM-dependent MidA family methyltransferase
LLEHQIEESVDLGHMFSTIGFLIAKSAPSLVLNPLVDKIAAEIRKLGPISFARFMELALYCPVYGYYEKEADTVGRRGDYYTSVSVGPLFGELLALRFGQWLDQLVRPGPGPGLTAADPGGPEAVQPMPRDKATVGPLSRGSSLRLVEAGAHKGDLARDILGWFQQRRPELLEQLQYVVVEPSPRRQQWQRETLESFLGMVHWVSRLEDLASMCGIIFSNELLDSLPVHRLAWDAPWKRWIEWGVSFDKDKFNWVPLGSPGNPAQLPGWSDEVLSNLPDGFAIEVCPAAYEWWGRAAGLVRCGKLLTIDYGLTAEERLTPERSRGTLRGYQRHEGISEVLADPGNQDLTAHVNFTRLCQIGESAGLVTEGLFSQEEFLTRIAAPVLQGEQTLGPWTTQRTRQFQTLTHPAHLGRAFRVLVQAR